MTLEFTRLARKAAHLPENFLPAALQVLTGSDSSAQVGLIPVPSINANTQTRNALGAAGAKLGNPKKLSKHIMRNGDGGTYFLAPAPAPHGSGSTDAGSIQIATQSTVHVTIIIDSGLPN